MGYKKISNLQEKHPIFLFKEVYAMEKIHGTSTSITFTQTSPGQWSHSLFSGGIKSYDFLAMLESRYQLTTTIKKNLIQLKSNDTNTKEIIIYGEGYGGRCQNMAHAYGPLNFVAFEVSVDGKWYSVERAHRFVEALGLPFVYYEIGPATIEWLMSQRGRPSEQAKRNGMGIQMSEGIIIRAPIELYDENGGRLVAKYKRDDFRETSSIRSLTETPEVLVESNAIAEEWVVEERLNHVLSALAARGTPCSEMQDTGRVIEEMLKDVAIESAGQVVWSEDVKRAISRRTALLYKLRVRNGITNPILGE